MVQALKLKTNPWRANEAKYLQDKLVLSTYIQVTVVFFHMNGYEIFAWHYGIGEEHRVVQEFNMHNYIHHLLVHIDFGG